MDQTGLDELLRILDAADGSDLHLKVGSPPHIRVNGDLQALDKPDLRPSDTESAAKAIMGDATWDRFHEKREADFAYSVSGLGRFRVNGFWGRGSVGLVFRRVRQGASSFDSLGLPEACRTLAEEERGLILVTGPTGSGKTTTLAAMIDHINKTKKRHIITIEDPIEILHHDQTSVVNQREVGFDTLSFATALRAAMREDPDVILVGEMRDLETVETALSAAETGHLVLSTLHTIDSVETVNRIVDFFPPSQQHQARTSLAGSLKGTICQRLVQATGEKGRVPALEIMVVNGRIRQCIAESEKTNDISQIIADGDSYGMQTFDQSLVGLLVSEQIDLRSAMAAATSPHDLRVALQKKGMFSAGGHAVTRPPAAPTPPPGPVMSGAQAAPPMQPPAMHASPAAPAPIQAQPLQPPASAMSYAGSAIHDEFFAGSSSAAPPPPPPPPAPPAPAPAPPPAPAPSPALAAAPKSEPLEVAGQAEANRSAENGAAVIDQPDQPAQPAAPTAQAAPATAPAPEPAPPHAKAAAPAKAKTAAAAEDSDVPPWLQPPPWAKTS